MDIIGSANISNVHAVKGAFPASGVRSSSDVPGCSGSYSSPAGVGSAKNVRMNSTGAVRPCWILGVYGAGCSQG